MADHLHGYPQCAGPSGQPCPPSDLNYAECQSRGALVSCNPSVVDGIPTGQYHCEHREAAGKPKAKGKAKAKSKPKKAAKKAKKAARKPAKKSKGKAKGKAKGKKKGGKKKK